MEKERCLRNQFEEEDGEDEEAAGAAAGKPDADEDAPEEFACDPCATWLTDVMGYSCDWPLRISSGTPPEAIFEASIAVTTDVTGGLPLIPGTVTWVPRNELPVARLWVCDIWFICWRVVNCASWAIVCVGSIGFRGSWLDISVLSSFMKSVVLMPEEGFTAAAVWAATEELVDEIGDVADMGGVGSGKCAQMRGCAKGRQYRGRGGFDRLKSRRVGRRGGPAESIRPPVPIAPAVTCPAFRKGTIR